MNSVTYINNTIWWVISENKHCGVVKIGQTVSSNYNFIVFDNETEWRDKLAELDIVYIEPVEQDENNI